jgi:hypothetical protein
MTTSAITGDMAMPTIIRFNTFNSEFIDGWNSSLHFKIVSSDNCWQGHYMQSYLNLIKRVTLCDQRGIEIERIENVNLLNSLVTRTKFGDAFVSTTGASLLDHNTRQTDFDDKFYLWTDTGDVLQTGLYENLDSQIPDEIPNSTETYNVIIPLSLLCGLFRIDHLLPPQLMHQLEIRIHWENASRVFTHNINEHAEAYQEQDFGAPNTPWANIIDSGVHATYTLSDIHVTTDSYLFEKSLVDELDRDYINRGLAIKFQTYTQCIRYEAGLAQDGDRVTIPIEQSFSDATKLIACARIVAPQTIPATFGRTVIGDSIYPYFRSQSWVNGTDYHLRYNGVQYPRDIIDSKQVSYMQWLQSFGKNRLYTDVTSTAFSQMYVTDVAPTIAIDLNRNPFSFALSGSAVSTDTNQMVSGQRVDGTNPATLHMNLPAVSDVARSLVPIDTVTAINTQSKYVVSGWMEHSRMLVVQIVGNRVLA